MPPARVASAAEGAGTYSRFTPASRAARAMGSMPATGRRVPDRDSSPTKALSGPSSFSCPPAARMPTSMGRSYTVPTFRRSAGARFTVMRDTGKGKPQLRMAARTRSRASFTAASGRPTTSKAGSPADRSHSAFTS